MAVPGSYRLGPYDHLKHTGLGLRAERGPWAPRRSAAIDCVLGYNDRVPLLGLGGQLAGIYAAQRPRPWSLSWCSHTHPNRRTGECCTHFGAGIRTGGAEDCAQTLECGAGTRTGAGEDGA